MLIITTLTCVMSTVGAPFPAFAFIIILESSPTFTSISNYYRTPKDQLLGPNPDSSTGYIAFVRQNSIALCSLHQRLYSRRR